jgi:hypothetical protein
MRPLAAEELGAFCAAWVARYLQSNKDLPFRLFVHLDISQMVQHVHVEAYAAWRRYEAVLSGRHHNHEAVCAVERVNVSEGVDGREVPLPLAYQLG